MEIKPCDKTILLGRQGENLANTVTFDRAEWVERYGAGTFQLLAKRAGDTAPYPVDIAQNLGIVTWKMTSADTAREGYGAVELYYYVGDVLAKSEIWQTRVLPSLGDAGDEPPEPYQSWVDEVLEAALRAEYAAEDAQTAKTAAESAQSAAETSADAAHTAQETAEAAQTGAETAQAGAETAKTAAETAQAGAETAKTAAETAQAGAEASATAAQSAQTEAEAAQSAAETAKTGAIAAKTAAESAQTAAESAQTAAEAAADSIEASAEQIETNRQNIVLLGNTKADKTALADTDRRLGLLYALTRGQAWKTEQSTAEAYSKSVPSGAHAVEVQSIGGRSVVRNQLVLNSGITSEGYYTNPQPSRASLTVNTETHDVTLTKTGDDFPIYLSNDSGINRIVGHSYYARCYAKTDSINDVRINLRSNTANSGFDLTGLFAITSSYSLVNGISTVPQDYRGNAFVLRCQTTAYGISDGESITITKPAYVDLTQMFGAGNEPTTTDDYRIEELDRFLDANPAYYNTGEIIHADVDKVVSENGDSVLGELTILAAVRSLGGYGQSAVGGSGNTVDFEAKTYTKYGHYVDGEWVAEDTPIVTDISSLLEGVDTLLDAEGGGTVTFHQIGGEEIAVPNTTTAYINIAEALA